MDKALIDAAVFADAVNDTGFDVVPTGEQILRFQKAWGAKGKLDAFCTQFTGEKVWAIGGCDGLFVFDRFHERFDAERLDLFARTGDYPPIVTLSTARHVAEAAAVPEARRRRRPNLASPDNWLEPTEMTIPLSAAWVGSYIKKTGKQVIAMLDAGYLKGVRDSAKLIRFDKVQLEDRGVPGELIDPELHRTKQLAKAVSDRERERVRMAEKRRLSKEMRVYKTIDAVLRRERERGAN